MKLQDIFIGVEDEISLKIKPSIKDEEFPKKYNRYIRISFFQDAYWLIFSEKERFEVEGVTDSDTSNLDKVSSEQALIFLIKAEEKKAELKAKIFTSKIPITENLEIGFGDIIVDDIDKRFSRQIGNSAKDNWLKEQLIIDENGKNIILVNNSPDDKGFRIFGKKIIIDVKNSDNKLEISRIIKTNKRNIPSSFIEVDKIEIKDISQTAKIRGNIAEAINNIASTEQYLNTWKEYKLKEEEESLRQVQEYGFLSILNIKKIGYDKYRIEYKENKNIKNWLNIELESYIEFLDKREFPLREDKVRNPKAKLIAKKEGYIEVLSKDKLNESDKLKYAILSLIGDQAIQSRREWALEAIKNGATPMPQLIGILEGVEIATVERRKIKPLTSKVKGIFGEFGPNEMQEYALERALNTPDIVIIQGPPGTGKTKVITALSERLTELYKEEGKAPDKNILLTAFQHDAVDNMVNRTEVLGLPTIKAGKSNSIDIIDRWISEKVVEIEAEQSCIEPNENEFIYEELKEEYISYIETLNQNRVKEFLLKFKEDNLALLDTKLITKIENLFTQKEVTDKKLTKKMEELVRNIRTDKISYEDDGEINLNRFLKNYKRYREDIPKLDNIDFLESCLENSDEIDFEELESIKLDYLDSLISDESTKDIDIPIMEIEKIFKKLLEVFSKKIKSHGSIYSVLTEYQNDLISNKSEVQKAVEQYSVLLASTIQGSKSEALRNIKSDPFDTVIVDESARANPLDLLIPLTSAKRRIVLVGDHRQLPHIIDNALQAKVLEGENISKDANKHLEDSLFERFYLILKELAKKSNVVRVVTLDTQYRMHPIIGDFISRTFYEKYGDPKIKAGTPAKARLHGIDKYRGKVAVSINIPYIKGAEKQEFGSTYRPIEAREIVREAKEILDSNPDKSVGIITFYSRQVSEIFKEAIKIGLVEKDKEEKYIIAHRYSKTLKQEERFRIGSVDAFQGKEFDIVLLSLVRSNTNVDIRRKYGFLTSYNRLNVAMSRAKELLITVGDESMFKDKKSEEYIYGLYAFYKELVGGEYGCSI